MLHHLTNAQCGRAARRDDGADGAGCSGALEHRARAGQGGGEVGRHETAAQGRRSSYASATGEASSYARVHGEVSRAPAEWSNHPSVARETLDDVRYQKAEGIAKAHSLIFNLRKQREEANHRTACRTSAVCSHHVCELCSCEVMS